jgi:HlyD family secretion protein
MNAQMTQNVVTYTVIVTTDNSSGKLLPYLTANLQFEVDKRSGVLVVPNAALRWTPDAGQVDPTVTPSTFSAEETPSPDHGRLWVVSQGGLVRPLEVAVGMTDGTSTQISGSGVFDGTQVVVGEESAEGQSGDSSTDGNETRNPFLPKIPKGSKPPPGPM